MVVKVSFKAGMQRWPQRRKKVVPVLTCMRLHCCALFTAAFAGAYTHIHLAWSHVCCASCRLCRLEGVQMSTQLPLQVLGRKSTQAEVAVEAHRHLRHLCDNCVPLQSGGVQAPGDAITILRLSPCASRCRERIHAHTLLAELCGELPRAEGVGRHAAWGPSRDLDSWNGLQ
jgi:hypothetical protein